MTQNYGERNEVVDHCRAAQSDKRLTRLPLSEISQGIFFAWLVSTDGEVYSSSVLVPSIERALADLSKQSKTSQSHQVPVLYNDKVSFLLEVCCDGMYSDQWRQRHKALDIRLITAY
jgi:hypothetical protein